MNLKSLKKYKVPISILAIVLLSLILIVTLVTLMKPKNKESFFQVCDNNELEYDETRTVVLGLKDGIKSTCTSVTIPASVNSIGAGLGVFKNATNLQTITFQENSQLNSIGDGVAGSIPNIHLVDIINTDLKTYANDTLTGTQIMTAFTHNDGGHVVVIYNSDTTEIKALCVKKYVEEREGKVADVGATTDYTTMDTWGGALRGRYDGQKLSGGGQRGGGGLYTWGFGQDEVTSGKRTWKLEVTGIGTFGLTGRGVWAAGMYVGVAQPPRSRQVADEDNPQDLPGGRFLRIYNGSLYGGGKVNGSPQGYNVVKAGDKIELRLDADTGSLMFYHNDNKFGPGFATGEVDASNGLVLAVGLKYEGQSVTIVE